MIDAVLALLAILPGLSVFNTVLGPVTCVDIGSTGVAATRTWKA